IPSSYIMTADFGGAAVSLPRLRDGYRPHERRSAEAGFNRICRSFEGAINFPLVAEFQLIRIIADEAAEGDAQLANRTPVPELVKQLLGGAIHVICHLSRRRQRRLAGKPKLKSRARASNGEHLAHHTAEPATPTHLLRELKQHRLDISRFSIIS